MRTILQREGNRVWLDGVTGWSCLEQASSVHAAQAAAMHALGEDITYDYLVGVSGLAFRMQLSKGGFCPSSPHSWCGYQCVARSTQALPWKVRVVQAKPENRGEVQELRDAVLQSINRGVPVQYGREEDGLIIGYQKDGTEWLCLHPLHRGGKETLVETSWGWGVAVFSERKTEAPSRQELAGEALRQAVDMAEAGEAGNYLVGFRAWAEYLERLKALAMVEEQARDDAMLGNAWLYGCLVQYRGCASRYLREVASGFGAPAAQHLLKAADLYEQASSQTLSDADHSAASVAPYPWSREGGKAWTAERRQEQVRRLEAALLLEREAIAELKVALDSLRQPANRAPSLTPWANLGLRDMDAEVVSIHRLEQRASPLPEVAGTIRELITRLEICHFKIERHLQRILEAIGSLRLDLQPASIGRAHPKSGENAWAKDHTGRSRPAQETIWVLEQWLRDTPYSETDPRGISQARFEQVTRALGPRDATKTMLVSALLDRLRLRPGRPPLAPEFTGFWEQIERTDICHYAFPGNLERLLEGIGRLELVPDFVGCGSFGQAERSLAQEYFASLCAWLRGEPSRLASALGERTPVKEWLAACLAKTLKELVGLPGSVLGAPPPSAAESTR